MVCVVSIGLVLWLCVSISSLVCVVASARVVGGFLVVFLCSGCGLVLSLVGMLVCPICGVWLLCGLLILVCCGSFGGSVSG